MQATKTERGEAQRQGGLRGWLESLRAALEAALLCGTIFGLGDGVVADLRTHPPFGLLAYLGCFAAAVLSYTLLHGLLLGVCATLLHPWLGRRDAAARRRFLLATGLCLGLFLELYWWTRPYVFYGRSSVAPERLAAAFATALVAAGLGALLARILLSAPRRLLRGVQALALLSLLGGALFIAGERARVASRGVIGERNRDLPNVLLVVVDALRADVLGCYGNEQVKTPVIDELARRGVLFEHCFVQAPYTWTSFGSILTGKYPRRHGLIAQRPGVRMARTNVTLPLHLKSGRHRGGWRMQDEDYSAGTFMTGSLSHGSGLDRGFDVYTEALLGHDIVEVDSQWSVFRSELLLWIFKNKLQQRVDSELVVTLARKWLRRNVDRRWMAMVHLYSTHTPYDPPEEYRRMYLDPAYQGPFQTFYSYHREAIERGDWDPSAADVAQIRGLYYGGVSWADAMIGDVIGELERLGVLEDTLVIVTSDHGEDLGERPGYWEHNHMWQTNLRVPLVMSAPSRLPAGVRVPALVDTVDLLPTVCDLLDLELPDQDPEDPRSLVDGRSALALIRPGGPLAIREHSFAENALYSAVQDLEWKLIVPRNPPHDLLSPERPIEDVLDPAHPVQLYHLASDPHETTNRIREPESAEVALRLQRALRAWSDALPIPESEVFLTARDHEHERLLRSLGYTDFLDEDGAGPK